MIEYRRFLTCIGNSNILLLVNGDFTLTRTRERILKESAMSTDVSLTLTKLMVVIYEIFLHICDAGTHRLFNIRREATYMDPSEGTALMKIYATLQELR